MVPKLVGLISIAIAATLCVPANAAAIWCPARISNISVSPNGTLYPTFEGIGTPVLCYLNGTTTPNPTIGPITSEVCKLWYASLTTAMTTQSIVILAFEFGGAPLQECDALSNFSWQVPNPYPYNMQFER